MTDHPTATAERLSHETAPALFERIYALLNEHDVRHIPTVFTEDIAFDDDAWPERINGHAEMERFMTSLWRAMPDFRFELLEGPYLSEDGRHAAVRVRAGGVATGRFDPPGFAPTGTRVTAEYAGFYELEGERLKRGRVILNMNDVGVQIGALPGPGTPGERLAVAMQRLNARRMRRRARA
ncbi:MAG: nuclear transport factor 2 family protein [Actinomycetota bacterium]|nr:nuclear transport factor 2 family protein [Actinomycetota bacterium]